MPIHDDDDLLCSELEEACRLLAELNGEKRVRVVDALFRRAKSRHARMFLEPETRPFLVRKQTRNPTIH